LAEFHVSIDHGFQVSGQGLKIFGKSDLNVHRLGIQPLIAVDEFRFSAGILNLHAPMRVHRVYLKGLELNIPAREQRSEGISLKGRKIKIYVDEFLCEQAHLVINTLKPDKLPLEFDISNLEMGEIGPGQPLRFIATLVNPKPVGAIQSSGLFGPWQAMIHEARRCGENIPLAGQTLAQSEESAGSFHQPASTTEPSEILW